MKMILAGHKRLIPLHQVKFLSVGKYEEIAIKHVYNKLHEREELKPYFPDKIPKGRQIDKSYFWNVCHSIFPEEIGQMIKYSNDQRHAKTSQDQEAEKIFVSEEWM